MADPLYRMNTEAPQENVCNRSRGKSRLGWIDAVLKEALRKEG